MQTFVVIGRQRLLLKDGGKSQEMAYFITNQALTGQVSLYLFEAIRKYGLVEAGNHVRNITLGEDSFICRELSTYFIQVEVDIICSIEQQFIHK